MMTVKSKEVLKSLLFVVLTIFASAIPVRATITLSNDGWSQTGVGDWDDISKTGTLTRNVTETIEIMNDGITLDGDGYKLTAPLGFTGNGITLSGRTGVTIKNLFQVRGFPCGIYLLNSSSNTIEGASTGYGIAGCTIGIHLQNSSNNTIEPFCQGNDCAVRLDNSNHNNKIYVNVNGGHYGILLNHSSGNIIDSYVVYCDVGIRLENSSNGNTLSHSHADNNEDTGIFIIDSDGNTLDGNGAWSNGADGIVLSASNGNTLIDNGVQLNNVMQIRLIGSCDNKIIETHLRGRYGMDLSYSSNGNTISNNHIYYHHDGWHIQISNASNDNSILDNEFYNCGGESGSALNVFGSSRTIVAGNTFWLNNIGISLLSSDNSKIYNNNFIDNTTHVYVSGGTDNVFNLAKPIGGNYWSDWTGPDADHDGFVDNPYVFTGGQDNLPLTVQDGWTDEDLDGVPKYVEDSAPNGGDGNSDGTSDSEQANVASLPNIEDGRYVTFVSPDGTSLGNVSAINNPSPGDAPSGVEFPIGFFDFTVSGIASGGKVTVELLLPSGVNVKSYYKHGPTSDDPSAHWYPFKWDGQTDTGAKFWTDRVMLYFVDGERGDDDLSENGEIVEPGAPTLILNRPPVADAGPDQTVEQESDEGTLVTLNGSGSTDPDSTPGTNDDIVAFDWYTEGSFIDSGKIIEHTFGPGTHTVTLEVTDKAGETSVDDLAVIVQDTTPPTIHSVSANPEVLWPVNHKMVEVIVEVEATDNSGEELVCGIAWVESNEPVNGPGDGDTDPDILDWDFTEDFLMVLLRAERAGGGDGRVYTICVECTDAAGNPSFAQVEVTVPHDQGKGKK